MSYRLIPIWTYIGLLLPFALFCYQFKHAHDVNNILERRFSRKHTGNQEQHVKIVAQTEETFKTVEEYQNDIDIKLALHGDQSALPLFEDSSNDTKRASQFSDECGEGPFHIPSNLHSKCFVKAPENYTLMYDRSLRLWTTSADNLGALNTSVPDYHNQVYNQKWLKLRNGRVIINNRGGTSIRKFGDNYEYFNILLRNTRIFDRCLNKSKPSILDTGAGIASVAAAARDEIGGNSSVSVLSYVPVDNYLRLGTIISDRALPVYLHYYNGQTIPAPDSSFDMVHCRWCWHHVVGYDVWLQEVNRLLVPGGAFVFTFVPLQDTDLLPHEPWFAALNRMPWTCERHNAIVQICVKQKNNNATDTVCNITPSGVPDGFDEQISYSFKIIHENSHLEDDTDRVLNVDCSSAETCSLMENKLGKQNMLHTFANDTSGNTDLRKLLNSGSLGILHDWNMTGPFYPRMFDVVYLTCIKERPNLEGLLWEIHRLLRPGGFVFSVKSTCHDLESVINTANRTKFESIFVSPLVFVARRIDE